MLASPALLRDHDRMIDRDYPVLETARLRLDRLGADDAEVLFAYRADAYVARYQGWVPCDVKEAAAFIAEQARRPFAEPGGWNQLAIRARASGALLGDLGLYFPARREDAMSFGISLHPAHQHRGYAREAMHAVLELLFGQLGCHRVVASVDPRNTPSLALCRALGMRLEAHHVESLWFRGDWVDDVVFALLAREWPIREA